MKNIKKSVTLICVFVLSSVMMFGCGSSDSGSDSQTEDQAVGDTIELVYVNWAEGVAMTNLAKAVLEEKMDYTVELTMADAGMCFSSVAEGDSDAFMDAWLPVTHEAYWDEYSEDLEDIGVNFEGAKIGLVVPSYMDVDTIAELNDIADELDGDIIGIDAGAGIMSTTETAIDTYELDLNLVSGSEAAMTTTLSEAIENEEPVVITGWSPHWMFAKWDLKYLDDTEGVYGDEESIHTVAREGFSIDEPEVAEFLAEFSMNDSELGDLMGAIADKSDDQDEYDVAVEWMNEHEDLVNSWIPESE